MLTLLIQIVSAQEKFEGYVYDVGKQIPINGVSIQSTITLTSSVTNNSGFFSLELFSQKNKKNNDVSISDNTLFFDVQNVENIVLYNLQGQTVINNSQINNSFYRLPSQVAGYYVLVMKTNKDLAEFLLFSDGVNFYERKKKSTYSLIPMHDTLVEFNKENYFTAYLSLNKLRDTDKVLMLRKSYESLKYFNELLSYNAFKMLDTSPPTSNFGEVESIKALYDFSQDEIYYCNTKIHHSHFYFAKNYLNYEYDASTFLFTQYTNHSSRFLNLITINYHKNMDKYVVMLSPYDVIDCDGIKATFDKVLTTSYFGDKLYFYVNNLKWKGCIDIPTITSQELFLGQNYQALNLEENYGYLRKVEVETLNNIYLNPHDLVLMNGIPNDLPVVSGIITTEFQTALSHINILSHNRHTPNMALKDGWNNHLLDSLLGKLVYLKVASDSFIIRKANIEEAQAFWDIKEPQEPIILSLDTITQGIVNLDTANISSVRTVGGKAANFSELISLGMPIPENYFAIPFYYYQQHLKQNGLDVFIDEMLNEPRFYSDYDYRKIKLIMLRNRIIHAPFDEELLGLVRERIHNFETFSSFRFRSSTNAEDLENFSGAGLYNSFSAKKDNPSKTIEEAIKKVWASLWNLRAYEERAYYKIDPKTIAMGVLVHRSFPNEDANGVVITSNLYNVNHAYTINVQYKNYSIVYPEPNVFHDQILMYTINFEQQNYTIEYLSHSNVAELNGETVLSDEELYELADYCSDIKYHYFEHIAEDNSCGYESFSVDIEFKVDSPASDRQIYIKQARIYKKY